MNAPNFDMLEALGPGRWGEVTRMIDAAVDDVSGWIDDLRSELDDLIAVLGNDLRSDIERVEADLSGLQDDVAAIE